MSKKIASRIPTRTDWGNLDDIEVRYAYKLYGNQSIAEALPHFECSPIQRADELRFAPWEVCRYYIFCFAEFLTSDESTGECDCAACFLSLVLYKALAEPERIPEIYPRLKPAVDIVAGRQAFYDADSSIYGSFTDTKRQIDDCIRQ